MRHFLIIVFVLVCACLKADIVRNITLIERSVGIESRFLEGKVVISDKADIISIKGEINDNDYAVPDIHETWISLKANAVEGNSIYLLFEVSENNSEEPRSVTINVGSSSFQIVQSGKIHEQQAIDTDDWFTISEGDFLTMAKGRYVVDSEAHILALSNSKVSKSLDLAENTSVYPQVHTVVINSSSIDIIQMGTDNIVVGNVLQITKNNTYFDLNIVPESSYTYEMKGSVPNANACFFGSSSKNSNEDRVALFCPKATINWQVGSYQSNPDHNETFMLDALYTDFWTRCSKEEIWWKSNSQLMHIKTSVEAFPETSVSLCLFCLHNGNAYANVCGANAQISSFKVFDGETLINYFVPSETETDGACLYDLVGHQYILPLGNKMCVTDKTELLHSGLITIIEDDGRSRLIDDKITDLYESYGILPTLAINPGQIKVGTDEEKASRNFFTGSNGATFPVMSFNEIKSLHEKGYDIQDHSWSHADFRYVWYNDSASYTFNGEQRSPVAGKSWWLDETLDGEPYTFGGPWNKYSTKPTTMNQVSDQVVWENCKAGVSLEISRSWQWLEDYLGINYHDILVTPSDNSSFSSQIYSLGIKYTTTGSGKSFENQNVMSSIQNYDGKIKGLSRFYLTDSNVNHLMNLIDQVIRKNQWIILLIHSVNEEQMNGDSDVYTYGTLTRDATGQTVSRSTYERVLKKIKTSGIKYATFHEAVTKYELAR